MTAKRLSGKELQKYKDSLKLTSLQKELIVGTLLGDSTMPLNQGKPTFHLKFEQKKKNQLYVEHLYEIFKPFVLTGPKPRLVKDTTEVKSYWFRTLKHSAFIHYDRIFYKIRDYKRVKVVPSNIAKLLTPRALAYWFMDDGSCDSRNSDKAYYLHTQGFTKQECQVLCEVLNSNFDLKATLSKDGKRFKIYIWVESAATFRALVSPYLHPIFNDKL